jgi:predicted oxidoreductase
MQPIRSVISEIRQKMSTGSTTTVEVQFIVKLPIQPSSWIGQTYSIVNSDTLAIGKPLKNII